MEAGRNLLQGKGSPPTLHLYHLMSQKVDVVDAKCRAAGITADEARRVPAPLPMPGDRGFDAYRFLRGSGKDSRLTDSEVREILAEP